MKIPDNIRQVADYVSYTLWLDNTDYWFGLSVFLRARLNECQRVALAYMALRSLDHDQATLTAQAALFEGAGQPIAPLFNHMDEAVFWADLASPEELDAYVLASFNRMVRARQVAFLDFVHQRTAA